MSEHITVSPMRERVAYVRALIDALYEDVEESARAIAADGWPLTMARAGLMLHRHTWNVDALCALLERELHALGGLRALDTWSRHDAPRRIRPPRQMIHIWPALPGAGLTPVLLGLLLGAKQIIRPSSRGTYFAQHLFSLSERLATHHNAPQLAIAFGSPDPSWRTADAIIASGSDETLAALRDFLHNPGHRARPTLLGYGHRVSFALIIDDLTPNTLAQAPLIAHDAVMWHQLGCFSARAVIFCGSHQRAVRFTEALGEAIATQEHALDATRLPNDMLATRAQALGLADLFGQTRHGTGLGWAHLANTAWTGDTTSPHSLSVHPITSPSELSTILAVPTHQLQGAALYAPHPARQLWAELLASRGVTRICTPGRLQAPSPSWHHDGIPNLLDFLSVCTIDEGLMNDGH